MMDRVISAIAQTARNWLASGSPWRACALQQVTAFSPEMVSEIVDRTFRGLTEEAFRQLLKDEIGQRSVRGPRVIAHVLAGNVPSPSINSICFGLLLGSRNLVKPSSHDRVFPSLFVESLREVDPELAGRVEVLDWRREDATRTRSVLAEADAVIAFGSDESVATLRQQTRPEAIFLGYGHKLSFGVVGRTAEHSVSAKAAAEDVCVYDQQGCMSPHAFYVEKDARGFASALADAMAAYQQRIPRGQLSFEENATISRLQRTYEFRSASDHSVAVWSGEGYLVIYEEDPRFTPSCLNRVVFVKPYRHRDEIVAALRPFAGHLSTAGTSPLDGRWNVIGAHRICPIGEMQRPKLWEPHDGQPNLAALAR